jgi:hypothetical protein
MAFLVIDSNVPRDLTDPLISFRVQGREVAHLSALGVVNVQGVGYPDGTYSGSSVGPGNFDGGQF